MRLCNTLLWPGVFHSTTTFLLNPITLSHQWLLQFLLATDVHLDALPCLTDFYFPLSFCSVNNFCLLWQVSVSYLLMLFSFLSICLESFFWGMFSFGGFGHSVTLSQKEYSSPLLVGQSVLSIFCISVVIFLLEESFCIIISLLITISSAPYFASLIIQF